MIYVPNEFSTSKETEPIESIQEAGLIVGIKEILHEGKS